MILNEAAVVMKLNTNSKYLVIVDMDDNSSEKVAEILEKIGIEAKVLALVGDPRRSILFYELEKTVPVTQN